MLTNKHSKHRTARIEVSALWLPASLETEALLKRAEELASRDHWTMAQLLRESFIEYVNRHHPGNPTPPLETYSSGLPLSEAAQEKLRKPQERFGLRTERCDSCKGSGRDKDGMRCLHCGGHGVFYIE